jgi:hypothetical protein
MCHDPIRHPFSVDHVCRMIRNLFEECVRFYEVRLKLRLALRCTMSAGIQYVGPAMCARSDRSRATASHFYEKVSPFPIVFDIGAMLQGYRTVQRLNI